MAATTNVQVIIDAKDNASSVLKGVGASSSSVAKGIELDFKGAGVAAAAFLGSLTALATGAVKVASSFEQNRISFETMMGSAEKAKKMMSDLAKFTLETPFEMPQVVQGAKSLMAYGIEAEKIIPTFKMLGDIASGVGMDKLPNLVLAFGQVKAATRLTGMELRQFTEAGVPMLQALVDNANKAGGSWVTLGGGAKKAKVDVDDLNQKLAISSQRLKEAEGNAKTKTSTLMSLKKTIGDYQEKLSSANETTGKATKVWSKASVTVAEMKDRVTDGAVSFQEVQAALATLTEKGGKFQDMMLKQSKSFAGLMSNIKDKITQSLSEIAGVSVATGEIREGSLFAVLKKAAEELYKQLDIITPKLVKFFEDLSKNKPTLLIIAGIIGGLMVAAVVGFVSAFGGAIALATAFATAGAVIVVWFLTIKKHIDNAKEAINKFAPNLSAWASQTKSTISTWISETGSSFDTWVKNRKKNLEDFLKPWKEDFKGQLQRTFIDVMFSMLEFDVTTLSLWVKIFEGWKKQVQFGWEYIKKTNLEFLRSLPEQITTGLTIAGTAIGVWFESLRMAFIQHWENVKQTNLDFLKSLPEQFVTGLTTVGTTIWDWLQLQWTNFTTWWEQIGKDSPDKLLEGFEQTEPSMAEKIVTYIIAFIGVVAITLAIGFLEAGRRAVTNMYNGFIASLNSLIPKIHSAIDNFIADIKKKIEDFKPKISIGLDLPDIAGAWNSLKSKAKSMGVPGFQTGGIVPGPIGATVPIMAHAGERVTPTGLSGSGGGGGGITFNVTIGLYAGTETEKRNVAKELYGALVQLAQSQNKNVRELMGA